MRVQVRFDHQSRTVHFDAWQSQAESARQQLATLAAALGKAVGLIKAEEPAHAARTHQVRTVTRSPCEPWPLQQQL